MPDFTRPDLNVNIIPPQVWTLNAAPANVAGIVGSASWGPVNAPVLFSDAVDGTVKFGTLNARKYDLMTVATVASFQGKKASFIGVRVTDGTDAAATGSIGNNGTTAFWTALAAAINFGQGVSRGPSNIVTATAVSNGLTLAAKYTGSMGNRITATIGQGSQSGSYRLTLAMTGRTPEVFDNLGATQAAAVRATGTCTFTQNPTASQTLTLNGTAVTFVASNPSGTQVLIGSTLAQTLANLLAFLQGSSDTQLVKFTYSLGGLVLNFTAVTAGTGGNSLALATTVTGATLSGATLSGGAAAMTAPTLGASVTLAGGTDGATTITKAIMLGSDVAPRTGMYALRSTGVDVMALADLDDLTSWSVQDAFAQSEYCYPVTTGPAGDTVSNAETQKLANGIDTAWLKCMHGDWVTFNDTTNNLVRKISPQGFALGILANLGPHESSLNKRITGIVSTEKSASNQVYSGSDVDTLYRDGYDVIANPVPGGIYFGCRNGRNGSSNPDTRGDNYTRMSNYLARAMRSNLGTFIGRLQSVDVNDPLRRDIKVSSEAFLGGLKGDSQTRPRMIDDYEVQCDLGNNNVNVITSGRTAVRWTVRYLSVVEVIDATIEGGQTVQIQRSTRLSA